VTHTEVDRQEFRLKALEDERGIVETLHRYCHTLDYGLEDEWMDCFTEDAAWSWTVRDADVQKALIKQGLGSVPIGMVRDPHGSKDDLPSPSSVGSEQLRKIVVNHTNAPDRWHKHSVSNTTVRIDGDSATAASYFVRVDASVKTTGAYIRAFGRYLDDLVRCSDGKWRIRRRHAELEAHYDEVILGA
jgi:hypothetical protein